MLAQSRLRDHGVEVGVLRPGTLNAITDVPGVKVGQFTLNQGDDIRTGVTAILPHSGNIFQEKVPAAIYVGNGFGKLQHTEHPQLTRRCQLAPGVTEAVNRTALTQTDPDRLL